MVFRFSRLAAACLAAGAAMFTGCVQPQDVGVGLMVSPTTLNFGYNTDQLVFTVNKTFSSSTIVPLVAQTAAPWVIIETCDQITDGCVIPLTGEPGLPVVVSVDRTKTELGTNRARIQLLAASSPVSEVEVVVEDTIKVDFSVDATDIEAGQTVKFTDRTETEERAGLVISKLWDFGDGTTSTDDNPTHRYTQGGAYSVSLTVTTENGTETVRRDGLIAVELTSLVADFTADRTSIFVGDTVNFTDRSGSPNGPITRHDWDFGDGETSSAQNPSHTYDAPGFYTVTLEVESPAGTAVERKQNYIQVQQKLGPTARFGVSTAVPLVNFPVEFFDQSDPGTAPIVSWQWDFGDTFTSTERNPTHIFRQDGTFNVTLTVTTAHGSSTFSLPIAVQFRPPQADFTAEDQDDVPNDTVIDPSVLEDVQFFDRSIAGSFPINRWEWNFGDGKTSTQQHPVHRYEEPGTYTVTLTVFTPAASNNSDTEVKEAFVVVVNPPSPDFSFAPRSVFTNTPVRFTNLTIVGSEQNVTYLWDLDGDPQTTTDRSTSANPTFTYTAPGRYVVSLTARTPTRTRQFCRAVVVDTAPVPDFTGAPRSIPRSQSVQFTDATLPGVAGNPPDAPAVSDCEGTITTGLPPLPISSRRWEFGDGETSTFLNPSHAYEQEGTFTTALTITFAHSGTGEVFTATEEKPDYITVTPPAPPVASFEFEGDTGTACIDAGQTVVFMNTSSLGSANTATYFWDFGDGATSTEEHPTHTYLENGSYDVTLTVTTPAQFAPNNVDSVTRDAVVRVGGTFSTALDEYVAAFDPSYEYTVTGVNEVPVFNPLTLTSMAMRVYTINMTSQTWRSTADYEVYPLDTAEWNHSLSVIVPPAAATNTGMLFITGGGNPPSTPNFSNPGAEEEAMLLFSAISNSVVSLLEQVPNQPLEFIDEAGERRRTEDESIAYTFDEYLTSVDAGMEDGDWPLLLPMVKSAVRAMDTVQDLYLENDIPVTVDDFVVAGASKRGWTTWLTGAVDTRVRAIAPIVIDVLNMDVQMRHHFAAYGYWAPAIYPYAQERVFDRIATDDPAGLALLGIVDPFEYRCRMDMPKYIMNSTGDQFFLPDSGQFYLDRLEGEDNLVNYVPNTDHGMSGALELTDENSSTAALLSFYMGVIYDHPLPEYSWEFLPDGGIEVNTTGTPRSVRLYQATNTEARDFRLDTIGEAWTFTNLAPASQGRYVGRVAVPQQGWRGFFIQLRFPNPAAPSRRELDFVVTSPIRVLPITETGDQVYPPFDGERLDDDLGVPSVIVHGSPAEMGEEYGRAMAGEIAAFIPGFLAAAQAADPGLTNAALDSVYAIVTENNPRFVEELEGVALGAGIDLNLLRRANMVPVLSNLSGHAVAATGVATPAGAGGFELTLQSNGIEWSGNPGFGQSPAIVVYVPGLGEGVPHANITAPGLVGAITGINLAGIGVSTVQDPDAPGEEGMPITSGTHFSIFNRNVLFDSLRANDALTQLLLSDLIRRTHLVFSDGRNQFGVFKARIIEANRPGDVTLWPGGAANDEFAPDVLPDTVYSLTRTEEAPGVFELLTQGIITPQTLDDVRAFVNQSNASGDPEALYVRYESGFDIVITAVFDEDQVTTFSLQELLP